MVHIANCYPAGYFLDPSSPDNRLRIVVECMECPTGIEHDPEDCTPIGKGRFLCCKHTPEWTCAGCGLVKYDDERFNRKTRLCGECADEITEEILRRLSRLAGEVC